MWSMGRITKWWCKLTVRWWTPGSSTSKAPPSLLTSEISRGIKPTLSLVPLQQPPRRPMLSAPSQNHYSSTLQLHWKTKNETLPNWRVVREMMFSASLVASRQLAHAVAQGWGESKKEAVVFYHPSIYLQSTGNYMQGNISVVAEVACILQCYLV